MPVHDEFGNRMKDYEKVSRTTLERKVPVAIRIDGKAFHTFTRGFDRPFDEVFARSMQSTMHYLCENIQGCVLGYTQSDEITLILIDYMNENSDAWFGYQVQKMCSVAASMATMEFNRVFETLSWFFENDHLLNMDGYIQFDCEDNHRLVSAYHKALSAGAMFDARVFNIPKEEVTNLIYWRQTDARRNSIQMVGQANFSHKQLQGKSCNDILDMLVQEKGINWEDYPTYLKHGSCCIKNSVQRNGVMRSVWSIDKEIPAFKGEGREYIDKLIFI